jgi:2-amino-4-hydroxy-6-hydroxymethyldihydropteridine diphosphokinase
MTAAIALGSNLPSPYGPPEANLREALRRLAGLGHVAAVSTFHATDPVGYLEQPRFLNAAVLLETNLSPLDILHHLLAIEHAMGRDRANTPAKGPRIIDLDLLLYTDANGASEIIAAPNLTLPHPSMHERRFVLAPLAEIAPTLLHPTFNRTIADLLANLSA